MSSIWIFRHMRSGSTAFSELAARQLNRQHLFIPFFYLEKFSANPINTLATDTFIDSIQKLYSTHTFDLLNYMEYFDDPLLIRCARRDKVEQCLSYMIVKYINHRKAPEKYVHNLISDCDSNKNLFEFDEPIYISKKEVFDFMRNKMILDRVWEEKTLKYRKLTIYYEDLCSGVDIPELNLVNYQLTNNEATVKLPTNKNAFLNEDHIRKWVEEYQCLNNYFG